MDAAAWAAWGFYKRCVALGNAFPQRDEMTAQIAVECKAAVDDVDRVRRREELMTAIALASLPRT
jgi:hypothetical protein